MVANRPTFPSAQDCPFHVTTPMNKINPSVTISSRIFLCLAYLSRGRTRELLNLKLQNLPNHKCKIKKHQKKTLNKKEIIFIPSNTKLQEELKEKTMKQKTKKKKEKKTTPIEKNEKF